MLTSAPVAAGFDAAAGDELGGCFVTPACYAHMTHMLMTLAGGKVAVCLEVSSNNSKHVRDLSKYVCRVDIISDQSQNQLSL